MALVENRIRTKNHFIELARFTLFLFKKLYISTLKFFKRLYGQKQRELKHILASFFRTVE